MKRFLMFLVGCILSISATASDWMELNDDEEATISVNVVDLKNQRIKNINSVGAWVKSVYKSPQINQDIGDGKPIAKFISMHWHQCQSRSVSDPVEVAFYGVKGEFIDSYSEETSAVSFRHVTPDTIESNIHTVVCIVDLTNQIEKLKERGPVSDYDYRRLKNEYPYQFRLIQEYNSPN